MKKIALSLPYSYLSNSPSSLRDKILTETFSPAEKFLQTQKNILSGIELSNFNSKAPTDQVISACSTVLESGLSVILHCHLPDIIKDGNIDNVYPWFSTVQKEAALKNQGELMLNLHSLSSKDEEVTLKELTDRTVENLKLIIGKIENAKVPTRIALEINREKGIKDPSTTYECLVEICDRVNSPLLGIGWDIGHTYSNILNGHISLKPPKEFVEKVIHTHIHDVGKNNETHWPLTTKNIPLDVFVGELESVHYDGFYTLEIYPERFGDVMDPYESILKSVSVLEETKNIGSVN